jgi:hypothetical protein
MGQKYTRHQAVLDRKSDPIYPRSEEYGFQAGHNITSTSGSQYWSLFTLDNSVTGRVCAVEIEFMGRYWMGRWVFSVYNGIIQYNIINRKKLYNSAYGDPKVALYKTGDDYIGYIEAVHYSAFKYRLAGSNFYLGSAGQASYLDFYDEPQSEASFLGTQAALSNF